MPENDKPAILNKNTPQGKGFRTAYQAIGGTIVSFITGLIALPEVRNYTLGFIHTQGVSLFVTLLGLIGVSSGVIALLQNLSKKR